MIKTLSYAVTGQRIEVTETAMLVAGTVNVYTARFSFGAEWDGLQRTAVFAVDGITREQLLEDDACTVPWEVLVAGNRLRVGVYGTKADGTRLPTIWTERRLYINPGAGPTQEAADPSPTLVEQLLARMGDLATLKTEDKSSLVAAVNEIWMSGGSGGASVTDDVVADVTQLKADVVEITPDDTTVDGKPWTSKKIVDSLCMPFEESGNPVQCYPVENYPLGVKVQIEPIQEGSGDPSPDNIRPITGRDAVSVTRCGKNLLKPPGINRNSSGIVFTANDDGTVTINGTSTDTAYYNYFDAKNQIQLAEGDYVLIPGSNLTRITCKNISTNTIYSSDVGQNRIAHLTAGKYTVYIAVNTGITADNVIARPQIVLGTTATPYEPYTGDTYDIALPKTVYGGTLDVETGVVNTTWGHIASYAGEALPGEWISDRDVYSSGAVPTTGAQVVYKLAEPITIQLTPQQITALSGVNTLYTNADGVVVTGAEDPKHTITELKNAIISLGDNI